MLYLVKMPGWLKRIYPDCIWEMPGAEKKIYLSFDDGPHPVATTFVLNELKKFNAKATFFCIGKNVAAHRAIYEQLIDEGHTAGNHTYDHLNGWKTKKEKYIDNIFRAKEYIASDLFRPPYGRITKRQLNALRLPETNFTTVMWTVLSGDFDADIDGKKCLENVINNAKAGSIVVFHDSEKAFSKLKYVLPEVLDHFSKQGYNFIGLGRQIV